MSAFDGIKNECDAISINRLCNLRIRIITTLYARC